MHFDVEIYFSGICFFDFHRPHGGCDPESCTVLLVDATEPYPGSDRLGSRAPGVHAPRMIVPARNFIVGPEDPPDYPMTVSENGEDQIFIDLRKAHVELEPSCGYPSPLYVPRHRARGKFKKPEDAGARGEWYDWIAILRELDPAIGHLKRYDCTFSEHTNVIACIHFSKGDVENLELGRARGENLVFEFRQFCGEAAPGNDAAHERCLSDRMVLRFRGLTQPLKVTVSAREPLDSTAHLRSGTFGIGASGPERRTHSPVRASITNLDKKYHRSHRAIDDFLWYYELFDWCGYPKPVEQRIIPWQQAGKHSGHTPSEGNCPPGGS